MEVVRAKGQGTLRPGLCQERNAGTDSTQEQAALVDESGTARDDGASGGRGRRGRRDAGHGGLGGDGRGHDCCGVRRSRAGALGAGRGGVGHGVDGGRRGGIVARAGGDSRVTPRDRQELGEGRGHGDGAVVCRGLSGNHRHTSGHNGEDS